MAVNNAQKQFNFAIEISGIDQFYIQEIKMPDVEVAAVKHGASNYSVKTAGSVQTGDAELMKLVVAENADNWAYDWLNRAQNNDTGQGGIPSQYREDIVVKRLNPAGSTIDRYIWKGAWVRKVSTSNLKRGEADENVIETVTVSIDKVIKLR